MKNKEKLEIFVCYISNITIYYLLIRLNYYLYDHMIVHELCSGLLPQLFIPPLKLIAFI